MKDTLPNEQNFGWGAINTQKRFKSYRSKAPVLIGQMSVRTTVIGLPCIQVRDTLVLRGTFKKHE